MELGNEDLDFLPDYLVEPNLGTRFDFAGTRKIAFDYITWGLSFQAEYLPLGYEVLGYAFAETDFFDLTITPSFRLFKGRFILNGSIRQRQDNLVDTKLATSERFTASAYGNVNF